MRKVILFCLYVVAVHAMEMEEAEQGGLYRRKASDDQGYYYYEKEMHEDTSMCEQALAHVDKICTLGLLCLLICTDGCCGLCRCR